MVRTAMTGGVVLIVLLFVFPARADDLPPTLTPPPASSPRLTGTKVFGVRPGHPFVFGLTATGTRPMTWSADGLPPGLKLDPATGRITGEVARRGVYAVRVGAENSAGKTSRALRIVVGDRLCLTPPLGWNSWNRYGVDVTEQDIRQTADAMVAKGLADHGYTYVNIDEGWEGPRSIRPPFDEDHPGPLTAHPAKFPSGMKSLADYVHGKGLKFGLYSVSRDAGYGGSVGGTYKEALCGLEDVRQMADWGADYLKYDGDRPGDDAFCDVSMGVAAAPRDIILTFCSSTGCDFHNVRKFRAISNAWRLGYDLIDDFNSVKETSFNGYSIYPQPEPSFWAAYTGPGRFIDCDMLVVGRIGKEAHPSRLSPDQQYVQVTQDAMLASPILASCDLPTLDPFTIGLLTNDEVLDVDQDPLGMQATRVRHDDNTAWSRPLEDGSRAVALYNFGDRDAQVTVRWDDLKITGPQKVRDLWRQKSHADADGAFTATVRPNGVVLVKLTPADPGRPAITLQPVDASPVAAGQPAAFEISADGAGPLAYQWLRDGNPIEGATSARLRLVRTSADDDGSTYRCVVSNRIGSILSYEASLKVLKPAGVNLVSGERVTASSAEGVWKVAMLADGNDDTFWGARGSLPQWVVADLGATYEVNRIRLVGLSGAAEFDIQVAPDGGGIAPGSNDFGTIKHVSGITTWGTQTFDGLSGTGRYVRLYFTRRYGPDRERICEFQVFGTP